MKKLLIAVIAGLLVITALGCSGNKEQALDTTGTSQTELPAGHPSFDEIDGSQQPSGQPTVDAEEVMDKINTALDKKFPGEWKVSDTTLQKGDYTENGNYGIVDEVTNIYPGSMVSLFVGEERISGTITGEDGKRVLEGYPTPEAVGQTMDTGKASIVSAGSIGSTNYQKVYLPIKSGDKTVAVLTISIAQ